MRRCSTLMAALLACTLSAPPEPAAAQEDSPLFGDFQRPGETEKRETAEEKLPERPRPEDLPPPLAMPDYDFVTVPDRWRLVEAIGVNERFWDPYHQSTLKGDRPIFGTDEWFVNVAAVSDTLVEPRRFPVPSGDAATKRSDDLDIFGEGSQLAFSQTFIASLSLIKGDTAFKPQDLEFRVTGVANLNYVEVDELGLVDIDPTEGDDRFDWHIGLADLFLDYHIWNKNDRYDFDSVRIGVQPMISDFRGFLLQDANLGARLFGTFAGNRLQYNLAYFRRVEKDTNSGVAEVLPLRDDDIFLANLYYQDFPVLGFTLQAIAAYNRNREDREVHRNENGFQERPAPFGEARPKKYDVVYLGLNGDGHIDRLNLTFSVYHALGEERRNAIAQRDTEISAWFAALEASVDFDWYRLKAFGLFQSGDDDPRDRKAKGFDAIFENPQFAGADTSFWVRQSIPLVFGGGITLSGRNAVLNTLRTSKEEGQSNFVNPGLSLVGVGFDADVLPELRITGNFSWLNFAETESLEVLRQQAGVPREIGWDLSGSLLYRPLFIENVVLRASVAYLLPGDGFEDLLSDDGPYYSILGNVVLTY